MTLSATATRLDGTVARVEFYNGSTLLNSDTAAPYAFTWSNVAGGHLRDPRHRYDNAGASATLRDGHDHGRGGEYAPDGDADDPGERRLVHARRRRSR